MYTVTPNSDLQVQQLAARFDHVNDNGAQRLQYLTNDPGRSRILTALSCSHTPAAPYLADQAVTLEIHPQPSVLFRAAAVENQEEARAEGLTAALRTQIYNG